MPCDVSPKRVEGQTKRKERGREEATPRTSIGHCMKRMQPGDPKGRISVAPRGRPFRLGLGPHGRSAAGGHFSVIDMASQLQSRYKDPWCDVARETTRRASDRAVGHYGGGVGRFEATKMESGTQSG